MQLPNLNKKQLEDFAQCLEQVLNSFVRVVSHSVKDTRHKCSQEQNDVHAYPFIPFEDGPFIGMMWEVIQHLRRRFRGGAWQYNRDKFNANFCDAGCGIGTKLIIAKTLGFREPIGIEIDPKLIKAAKSIYGIRQRLSKNSPNEPKIVRGDIREHDYSQYGVIYYYEPLHDSVEQKKFEQKVFDEVAPGSYIVRVGLANGPTDDRFNKLASNVFWRRMRRKKKQ